MLVEKAEDALQDGLVEHKVVPIAAVVGGGRCRPAWPSKPIAGRLALLLLVQAGPESSTSKLERQHMETPKEHDHQPMPSDGTSTTASTVLTAVWESMAEILGTAATATLMRRAAERGAGKMPNLLNLEISRDNLVRYYRVPESWRAPNVEQAVLEVSVLLDELRPLLARLTGQIVVRRIDAIAASLPAANRQRP